MSPDALMFFQHRTEIQVLVSSALIFECMQSIQILQKSSEQTHVRRLELARRAPSCCLSDWRATSRGRPLTQPAGDVGEHGVLSPPTPTPGMPSRLSEAQH